MMWRPAMKLKTAFALSGLLLLTACGTVSEWFKSESYEAPPSELTEFEAEFEPKVVWSVNSGDGARDGYADLGAWIEGDRLFSVDSSGDVASFDAQNGRRLWRTRLKVPVATGAGGGDGQIYVGTQKGELF